MINSVRFSIIENDLIREEQKRKDELDDEEAEEEEDRKSISSEGSGEGVPMSFTNSRCQAREERELWDTVELQAALHSLPGSDLTLRIIKSNDFDYVFTTPMQLNVALMYAVWLEHLEFVSHLLRLNADPNTLTDSKGRSALHYACITGNPTITKMLLTYKAKSHQWDKQRTVTPLHCAARTGSLDCIQLLVKNGAQLNAGIEKRSALHFAVQKNAIRCVQLLLSYGANPNTPQVFTETPLHIAAAMGFPECLKVLIDAGADVQSQMGQKKNTALHLAAEDDFLDCVKILLTAGANVNARNFDDQTPLHVACLSQSIETVEILIKHGADVKAIYRDGRTALHASIVKETRFWDCTRILLESKVDVNKADNYGYTPLHIAALNEFSTCAFLLIEYGADITSRTNGGISALSFIVRRTPDVIPKYLSKFDTSIKVNEHEIGDVDCEIKLNFRCLVPNNDRGETELLLAFIEVGQKRILKHPLCETFLFLKWRRIRKFFLFSLFYHALYVLLFTMYVLGVYVNHCRHLMPHPEEDKCESPFYIAVIGYVVLGLNFVVLTKEIFQVAHGFTIYIRYWENWLEWTIVIGIFLCAYPQGERRHDLNTIPIWQFHVAGIVVFLVWLELMMLVGRFPIFGLYVQMFTTVAKNFSKFLLAYCCLLMGFALSFTVLFSNYKAFKNVSSSVLKTVVMMLGELEFENILYDEDEDKLVGNLYPITSHSMLFAFVILVTIILMNLLVGLAVSDIQGLQASAGLNRLTRQAELVSRLESMMFSKLLRKAPHRILSFLQREALLRTSRSNLQICIRPNDPREKSIPKDIMASIYKLVAERRDRNQSVKRRRNNRNMSMFKESVEDVEYRRPQPIYRSLNSRQRTYSDLPPPNKSLPLKSATQMSAKMKSMDSLTLSNLKSQIIEIDRKFEELNTNVSKKLDTLTNNLILLTMEINKKND